MRFLHKILVILTGSVLISVGIHFFLLPFQVMDGGMIGIALILHYLFGFKVGLVTFLFSIPIFLLAWFYFKEIFYNSLYGLLAVSFFIDVMEHVRYSVRYEWNITGFTSAVLGGFIIGTGIGLMLKHNTSTGGTDLLAQYIARLSSLNAGVLIFVIDGIIVGLGGLLLPENTFLLSFLAITAGGLATSLCTWK